MINVKNSFGFAAVIIFTALGFLFLHTAQAQAGAPCLFDIIKETIPSDDTDFDFTCVSGQNTNCITSMGFIGEFSLMDGDSIEIGIGGIDPPFNVATVVEIVPDGWRLDDISCETNNPSDITFDLNTVPNGVVATCVDEPTQGSCTFRNIPQCAITIEKETIADTDTLFEFTAPDSSVPEFALENGEAIELLIDGELSVDVTELVPDGWLLEEIQCSEPDGVAITDIPNGRNFACNSPGGSADCVFINSPVRPLPTLSEWGLIATAAILGVAGLYAIRRRRASA